MPLLDVDGLSVEIPTANGPAAILRDVAFSVEAGRTLGIVGESGCGKSMTALAVMGLLPERARVKGRVLLDGEDLLGLDEAALCKRRGREVAMIFQEPMTALNPVKTIVEQVGEGLRLHLGLSRAQAAERAVAMLDRVGLPPARVAPDSYPHQLSGGQRQRAMIAMALICKPRLLIADEPTTALDVTVQAQILDLILDLVDEYGMGLMLITHDLGVIAETADDTLVMYAGRVVEKAPTDTLFAAMAHPYTDGLFKAMPRTRTAAASPGARRPLAAIAGAVPDPAHLPRGCAFRDRCPRADALCLDPPPWDEIAPGHRALCFHPITKEAAS